MILQMIINDLDKSNLINQTQNPDHIQNPDSNPKSKGPVLKTFFRNFSNTSKPSQLTSDSESVSCILMGHISRGNPPNLSPFRDL
ncbi:hypothetical protein KFK09_002805 [Dendrobium nobile]|uniref:Uncharacterized protein n=1 Tax=Dendrobium nobile TaxID=94219 RepID=A0A8T3C870_DENNO|nr:hypothetical protein KFK09_002805 [Dendrobium nobile]